MSKKIEFEKGKRYKSTLQIEFIRTENGRIRMLFGGGSYPIPDTMENIGIISSIEVEMQFSETTQEI